MGGGSPISAIVNQGHARWRLRRRRTEAEVAVVDRVVAKLASRRFNENVCQPCETEGLHGPARYLGPDVAELNARQRVVRLEGPQLDDERVWSVVLAVEEETRHQDAVRRRLAQAAVNPGGVRRPSQRSEWAGERS